jgi:hypothetical protein
MMLPVNMKGRHGMTEQTAEPRKRLELTAPANDLTKRAQDAKSQVIDMLTRGDRDFETLAHRLYQYIDYTRGADVLDGHIDLYGMSIPRPPETPKVGFRAAAPAGNGAPRVSVYAPKQGIAAALQTNEAAGSGQ